MCTSKAKKLVQTITKGCCYASFLTWALTACTPNYTKNLAANSLASVNLSNSHTHQRSADWVLHPTTPLCLNKSGNREAAVHNRSLIVLNQALVENLQQAFPDLTSAEANLPLDQAIKFARRKRCELLLNPALVRNKNNLNTALELNQGKELHPNREVKPDEVTISIEIYEARTGRLLDVAVLMSEQRYFTAKDKLPSDLYHEAIRRYVYSLTGRQPG